MEFPLKSGRYSVPTALIESLEAAYGRLLVWDEFPKACMWLIANPRRMKTERGMPRFLNAWLAKAKPRPQQVGIYTGAVMSDEEASELRARLK